MKKLFILFLIFFFKFNALLSNTSIAFIDIDKIISTSKPGLSIMTQLIDVNKKNSNKLKNAAEKLKIQENKLISQKNILSKEDFKSKIDKLKQEVKDYNQERIKINNNFKKLKIENTNKLLKLINPLLIKYSLDRSISIILKKKDIIMGKTELDITNEIIKIINVEIDEFKIQ
tara:strand:+ start:269 stop:787 length:519 start_codon:yes stop_codon:yes gene_type:complete